MFETKLNLYGLMFVVALITNIILVMISYKKYDFSRDEIIGALLYENMGIMIGGKIFTFIEHYSEYDEFNFLSLGISSYGALIGALIFLGISNNSRFSL